MNLDQEKDVRIVFGPPKVARTEQPLNEIPLHAVCIHGFTPGSSPDQPKRRGDLDNPSVETCHSHAGSVIACVVIHRLKESERMLHGSSEPLK